MNSVHRVPRANYDRLSRWYDLLSGSSERPARERGIHLLDLQRGERVLEIGCGTGEALAMLASAVGQAGCVAALDLSGGMLRVAKDKLAARAPSKIGLLQGDGLRLPFCADSFDAVFLSFTLELFPIEEIPALLGECKRALKPGGRIGIVALLQTEAPGLMEKIYNRAHRRWPDLIDCRPIPLMAAARNAGFVISEAAEMSMWGLVVGLLIGLKE